MKKKYALLQGVLTVSFGLLTSPVALTAPANMTLEAGVPIQDDVATRNGVAQQMAAYIDATKPSLTDIGRWIVPISAGGLFNLETGQWSDIDYVTSTDAAFPVTEHLERLLTLARCYTNSQCNESTSQALLTTISTGMKHFAEAQYTHKGWWFNYIGIPHKVGELLVYVRANQIPVNTLDYKALVDAKYLNVRSHWSYGRGANAIDIAIANMYSGVVRDNSERLTYYSNEALNEISRNNIGINADQSFFAHGPMLNTNSYGWVLVMRTLQVEAFTRGYYEMTINSQNLLERFMDQGVYPTFRGRYHDYLTGGRGGVSRENNLGRGFSTDTLQRLNTDREEHFALVNKVTSGQISADQMPYRSVKGYWNGDYLLKNEQNYQYSALTHSDRTMAIEQGNGENLLGSLMSMGSHSIRLSGDEYYNIFPLWDWLKIPGVTGREGQTMTVSSNNKGIPFSGVMSAGNNAIMVHSQNNFGVVVKKANFVFSDAIVAMASDVTANKAGQVTTSLDQNWFRGNVEVGLSNGSMNSLSLGEDTYSGEELTYLLHNGTAYMPLDNNIYKVSVEERTGKWTRVNSSESERDINGTVFSSWIDHGAYPTNATFSYAIYPGVTSSSVSNLNPRSRFATYQEGNTLAVYDKRDDVLQVILREAGQWSNTELTLASDQAGMFVVTGVNSQQPTLYFADPDQASTTVTVSLYNAHGGASSQLSAPNYQQTNVSSVSLTMGDIQITPDLALQATADTFVRYGGYSDDNYGSSEKIAVKADSYSVYRRHAYLQFPIDQVNESALSTAELELSVFNIGAAEQVIAYLVNDNSWDESIITANTTPEIGAQVATTTNNNGVFQWDVTDAVRNAAQQGLNAISLKLEVANNGSSNWVTFNSKESDATGPVINIDYNTIEEEASVVEDAFVQGGNLADGNFGKDSRLIVKLDPNSSDYTRESVLKFSIAHLKSDVLNRAEVVLEVKEIGQAMTLNVVEIDSDWSESNMTFNSLNRENGTPITVALSTKDQPVSINVTELVKSALEQDKQQISLRLYSTDSGGQKYATFYSKDSEFSAPFMKTSSY